MRRITVPSHIEAEGIIAPAWSFQISVCLSQKIKMYSKNKMHLMEVAFTWEQTIFAGCFMKSTHTFHILIKVMTLPNNPHLSLSQEIKKRCSSVTKNHCCYWKGTVLTRVAWYCSSRHTWLELWCCSVRGIYNRMSDTETHLAGTSDRCHRKQALEMSSEPRKHITLLIQATSFSSLAQTNITRAWHKETPG